MGRSLFVQSAVLKLVKSSAALPAWVLGAGFCVAAAAAAQTPDTPGGALRRYLDARWQGDLAAAEALWDPADLRRTQALGTSYDGLEARFDDNLLWTAAERIAMGKSRPAVADSAVAATGDWSRYTVVVPGPAGARNDSLPYVVRQSPAGWRVSSTYDRVAGQWSARDGKYVRVHATRLQDINRDAMAALDAGVEVALARLATPELVRLRLERLKVEVYVAHSGTDVRALCGSRPAGYQPAGERVVTRRNADVNAVARAVLHATLKQCPPAAPPVLEEGLAAALGGFGSWSPAVTAQRGGALAAGKGDVEAVLGAKGFAALPRETAVPLAAVWANALLDELKAEKFLGLYRDLSGTRAVIAGQEAAAVRGVLETATGKNGPALVQWMRTRAAAISAPLAGGCDIIPEESRTLQPIMRWRDGHEQWTMDVFEIGGDYVFAMGPYQGSTPKWTQKLIDSLMVARGDKAAPAPLPRPRPAGDPPKITILIRDRVYSEPEAYESPLFAEHFTKRRYAGDLFGLFISPDDVYLWDYRRDVLTGCFAKDFSPPARPVFYDQPSGRMCFKMRRELLPLPLVEYQAATVMYTGE